MTVRNFALLCQQQGRGGGGYAGSGFHKIVKGGGIVGGDLAGGWVGGRDGDGLVVLDGCVGKWVY